MATKGGQTATLVAMMTDFVPESIALGAVFALESETATFIGLQNLPEAFNSFPNLVQNEFTENKTQLIFFGLSFCGVIGALTGHFVLNNFPVLTANLMTFASKGTL